MSFESKVQQWVSLDNEIKRLNERVRDLREKKTDSQKEILAHVSDNSMGSTVVQLKDSKLKFVETKVQEPITIKYIEKVLMEVFQDESKVKVISDRIKKKRAIKVTHEIKRVYLTKKEAPVVSQI